MLSKYILRASLVLFLSVGNLLLAQVEVSGQAEKELPQDKKVIKGRLDNGLTYYIRENEKPKEKVELRLIIKAGSILEDEDQLGLAHFTEHMAFNGSRHFEKNELVSYLQSVGVDFGADLNAYTSFDETVYILPIPTEDPEVVEKGMLVLKDWASGLLFEEEEIDKERGVVIEEWRIGRGAEQRMRDEYFPILFKDSRYAERLPIGKKKVLETFDYETLKRFYQQWYRPNLMAVVAVGDIDASEIKKKIENTFGSLENPKNEREREYYDVPSHKETLVKVVSDKEASYTLVRLMNKHDNWNFITEEDYRSKVIRILYQTMLNQRLEELKNSADPPFIFAGTAIYRMVHTKSIYSAYAVAGPGEVEKSLTALITENERVKRHGFLESELERAKGDILKSYEKSYKERDKTESKSFADEYIRNFLQGEPIPGIEYEYELISTILPTIKLNDLNNLAEELITEKNRVVIVTGPEKEGVELPKEKMIYQMVEKLSKLKVAPYSEEEIPEKFMERPNETPKITSEKKLETIDAEEIVLENGATVILKSTDFKNDEIVFKAESKGGSSLYSMEDYLSADYAANIVGESGVGNFSKSTIDKMLSGKNVRVSSYIGELSEVCYGSASPNDFEAMLQLTYLHFTSPRKDKEAFSSFVSKNKKLYSNLLSDPQNFYYDKVSEVLSNNHPRGGGMPDPEDFDKIDLTRAIEIYKERFADASDFYFTFVGSFDKNEVLPLIQKYIGSLPSKKDEKESYKDLKIRPPKEAKKEIVKKGKDPKSRVTLYLSKSMDYSPEDNYLISSLGEHLTNKLIEILREEKGGVYGVGASGYFSRMPYEHYVFRVAFPCSPENVDDLIKSTENEIKKIINEGIEEEDLKKIKEAQLHNRKESLEKNNYWAGKILSYYSMGDDLEKFYEYENRVESLTAEKLQKAANRFLKGKDFIKIILMPEGE